MFVRNCWYVAAWTHELNNHALVARTVISEPLLIFRTSDNGIAAIADRCAHRQAPLSAGKREGDCVRCLYHGMVYDSAGTCVEIPGQTAIPSKAKVRNYPAVEHNNWIWVWMGNPQLADVGLLPDTRSLQDPEWLYEPGYMYWDVDQRLGVDNLLDFTHLSYVHASTLGGSSKIAETRPKLTRLENGVRIEWWLIDIEPAPFLTGIRPFAGNIDRWFFYDFMLPGVLIMRSGAQETGTGAPEGRIHDALELRTCQAIVPETAKTSHYFHANLHRVSDDAPGLSEKIIAGARAAFIEDRDIIRKQQRRWDDASPIIALSSDAALIQMRRMIDDRLRKEASPD